MRAFANLCDDLLRDATGLLRFKNRQCVADDWREMAYYRVWRFSKVAAVRDAAFRRFNDLLNTDDNAAIERWAEQIELHRVMAESKGQPAPLRL